MVENSSTSIRDSQCQGGITTKPIMEVSTDSSRIGASDGQIRNLETLMNIDISTPLNLNFSEYKKLELESKARQIKKGETGSILRSISPQKTYGSPKK